MENIYIALVSIIFVLILMNVILNKRFAIISSILYAIYGLFFCIKFFDNAYYLSITKDFENIEEYTIIIGGVIVIIALIEFIVGCFKKNKKEQTTQTTTPEIIIENKNDDNELNNLLVFLELFGEPLACFYDNHYIINSQMMKILNVNNFSLERNEFYSCINKEDMISFTNKDYNTFRINNNNESIWFEEKTFIISDKEYRLVNKMRSIQETKLNIHSFKELNSHLKEIKGYYALVNISIINTKDIISFYGKDFCDIVINKYLKNIYNLEYFDQTKLYYVDKSQYILLIDNKIEYEILLGELDNNDSLLVSQSISLANNIIKVNAKLGLVQKEEQSINEIIEQSFNMVNLAKEKDYPGDYAIYSNEEIENNPFEDLNIDLDLLEIKSNLK